jgi:signal transduction histidine kinase
MTIRKRLALRYALIVGACLLLLAGLVHHEFVTEPRQRKALGIPELPETLWGEYAEVFFYGMIPLVLTGGWWLMRRTLAPISKLAEAFEHINAGNLRQPLPRSAHKDEVDRLKEVFNSMAARLDESIQHIRHFTLHASHELKTPLTIMRIQLETMLQEEETLSPQQVEWLECELDEVQRLSKIVDALTLLTKADTGLVNLERKPVRLAELLHESFADAQILAEPNGVQVTLGEHEEAEVLGDRERLRQLLLNLTDNAIKYNRPGGRVTMALRKRDGAAEIEITNTGEGIPPALQPRVFERFVRGDEARSRAIEGCGLGLSICRWIVQAHSGAIQLSSEPGRSTTATVRLPLA